MNKLFHKVIARAVVRVLRESNEPLKGKRLIELVQEKLGMPASGKLRQNPSDIHSAVRKLVVDGRIEVICEDNDVPWSCYGPTGFPVSAFDYKLPLLEQLAAEAPEESDDQEVGWR